MSPAMRKICGQLAEQRSTTAEVIYQEMREAITEAYRTPQPKEIEEYRGQISRSGSIPSPEEVLAFLCQEMQNSDQVPVDN